MPTKSQSLASFVSKGVVSAANGTIGATKHIINQTGNALSEVFSKSSRNKILSTKSAALLGTLALGATTGGAGLAAAAGLAAGFKYIRGKTDYKAIITDPLMGGVEVAHGAAKIATVPFSLAGSIIADAPLPASRHSNFGASPSATADAGDNSTPDTNTTPAQTAPVASATSSQTATTPSASTPQSNATPSQANNTPPQSQPNPSNQANNAPTPASSTQTNTVTPSGGSNTTATNGSNASNVSTLTREQRRAQQEFENNKKEDLRGLSEDFETDVGDISKKLNDLVDKIKTPAISGSTADRYHIADTTKQESITKLLKKGSSRRDPQSIESLIKKDLFKKTTTTGYFSTETNYGPIQTSAISTIASTGNRIVTEITRKLRPLTDTDFTAGAGAGASDIKKDIIDDIKEIMTDMIKLIKDSNQKIKEKSEEQFDLSTA